MTNLPTTQNSRLSILTQEIGDLQSKLARATDDAVMARVLFLTRSGLKFPAELDAARAPQIYAFALKGCSLEALKIVCERIVQGRVETIRSFMPTAPELAALVRAEGAVIASDLARASATLDAIQANAQQPPVVDEAARRRVVAKLQDFRMNHKQRKQEENAGGKIVLDHERAERMKAIMAMPDAVEPTQEVLAYRRLIEHALPDAAPPPSEPVDGAYFKALQQQEENGDGNSEIGPEVHTDGHDRGGPEGQSERPFGFEDD